MTYLILLITFPPVLAFLWHVGGRLRRELHELQVQRVRAEKHAACCCERERKRRQESIIAGLRRRQHYHELHHE